MPMPESSPNFWPQGASPLRYENWLHCGLGLALAGFGFYYFWFEVSWRGSRNVIIMAVVYLFIVVIEMALRSNEDVPRLFELPHRLWSILLLSCLLVAVVCSYANLYIQSCEVKKDGQ